jgi:hypothetical protein
MGVRSISRQHYAAVVDLAGAWDLPKDLRSAMGSWQFDEADHDLGLADEVLAARDLITAQAGALHLTPPAALRQAFEGTPGLAAAKDEAGVELAVLRAVSKASDRLAEKETFLETIGLLGSDPEASLLAARTAFEGDRLVTAASAAEQALAVRQGAEEAGQTRVLLGGGGLFVAAGGTLVGLRVRRRHTPAAAPSPREASGPGIAVPDQAAAPSQSAEPQNWPMDPTA